MGDYQVLSLGDFKLQSGVVLPNSFIAYKTLGVLNDTKSNAIVFPSWYSGTHNDNEWLIGEDKALNPQKYYIIIPNMFGNGLSSSPSNTPAPFDGPRFPRITLEDNIRAQKQLIDSFSIEEIQLVIGWSMGAQQTYQWASSYPSVVKRIVPFCGSAKTSVHNWVFLEGPKNALLADSAFQNGEYKEQPMRGLRSFARVYAGWGFSQSFYRKELFKTIGFPTLESFMTDFWEAYFTKKDANNLLSMLDTWQTGDISNTSSYEKDFDKALASITAASVVLPGQTDLYFPPEDNYTEVQKMNGNNKFFIEIPSIWGHWAGGPGTNPIDVSFIDNVTRLLLEDNYEELQKLAQLPEDRQSFMVRYST